MKGRTSIFCSLIFLFTVTILLLRPAIIFTSHTLSSIPASSELKASPGKILKKRPELTRLNNIILNEKENIKFDGELLVFWLLANRRSLQKILLVLSGLLSHCVFAIRKKATLFDVVPDNHQYLSLSVIRI